MNVKNLLQKYDLDFEESHSCAFSRLTSRKMIPYSQETRRLLHMVMDTKFTSDEIQNILKYHDTLLNQKKLLNGNLKNKRILKYVSNERDYYIHVLNSMNYTIDEKVFIFTEWAKNNRYYMDFIEKCFDDFEFDFCPDLGKYEWQISIYLFIHHTGKCDVFKQYVLHYSIQYNIEYHNSYKGILKTFGVKRDEIVTNENDPRFINLCDDSL